MFKFYELASWYILQYFESTIINQNHKPISPPAREGTGFFEEKYRGGYALQAGVNVIQSLDLDLDATACMMANSHYFSHLILNVDIKDKTVLSKQNRYHCRHLSLH